MEARSARQGVPYDFPEDDLMTHLIELYFSRIEVLSPLLHRPTFDRSVAAGEHYRDVMFGGIVLLVCACGARFSDDPRVFLTADLAKGLSSGWKWFDQVDLLNQSMIATPSVYQLQLIAVSSPTRQILCSC
jgi:hypothetical protein